MSDSPLFSEHWHRVRHLKPRLADDVVVVQQLYRRVPTWILHRRSTTDYQRLGAAAWSLVQRFDGNTSVDGVWRQALVVPGGDAPTQNQFLDLLARMHEADLLVVDRRLGVESLFARGDDRRKRTRLRERLNPLFARFPLFDPDGLLERLSRSMRWVTGRRFAAGIAALCGVAGWHVLPRNAELISQLQAFDPLEPARILTFVVAYPLMKLVHELAHGLVLKRYGGEVREAGLAVMVLVPLPYVNASDAILLQDKRHRMLVSAAGVLAELAIALAAALVWSQSDAEVQQIALTVLAIGGVSTIVFNGNPLMRFDAYYLLADALEIPNLYARAQQSVVDIARRRLLGLSPIGVHVDDAAERRWLVGYGLAAGIFRIVLLGGVALVLGSRYFLFGVALASWIAVTTVLLPLWRFCRYAIEAPRGQALRARVTATLVMFALVGTLFVPLPRDEVAEGVVWLPEHALIRAPGDCRVVAVDVQSGATVRSGMRLMRCRDLGLETARAVAVAELQKLDAEASAADVQDRVRRRVLANGIAAARREVASLDERLAALELRAAVSGEFVLATSFRLERRLFRRGELIGYVVPPEDRSIRLALPESAAALLESDTLPIDIVFIGDRRDWHVYRASFSGTTGRAVRHVRHAALTRAGGGTLETVESAEGPRLSEPVFEIDLPWPERAPVVRVGSRLQARVQRPSASVFDRMRETLRRVQLQRSAA